MNALTSESVMSFGSTCCAMTDVEMQSAMAVKINFIENSLAVRSLFDFSLKLRLLTLVVLLNTANY